MQTSAIFLLIYFNIERKFLLWGLNVAFCVFLCRTGLHKQFQNLNFIVRDVKQDMEISVGINNSVNSTHLVVARGLYCSLYFMFHALGF
jgi:hypothetical protein